VFIDLLMMDNEKVGKLMSKKVSVIMGIYNCEKTLNESIESILNQTYQNWELIMCDDGSSDNTFSIAETFAKKDSRIKLLKNDQNLGLASTLNKCLNVSCGEYIMRHDGDDIMVPERMQIQVDYMTKNDCDMCGSGAYVFDDMGVWGQRKPQKIPSKHLMATRSPFIHPTVMIKREVLFDVGGYTDNKLTRQRLEDYDLWVKLFSRNYKLHNIQEPLIYFREDRNSYSRRKKRYRIAETRARIRACKSLKLPFKYRIFALKPMLAMLIPNFLLKYYHFKKANLNRKSYKQN